MCFIIRRLIIFKFVMDVQATVIPENTQVFLTLKPCLVHCFVEKVKTTLAEGVCQILQRSDDEGTPTDGKIYYIKVESFVDILKNSQIFIRINYPENTTYLFENEQGIIHSISFNKNTEGLDKFDTHFSEFSIILDFNSENIDEQLKKKIAASCPEDIETRDVSNDIKAVVKKYSKNVGSFIGAISNYVEKPAAGLGSAVSERASTYARESFSEETKTKWDGVVEKSKSLNDKMTEIIRPALNGYNNLAEFLGNKFYNSNSKVLKAIKDYSLAISTSLNQGEKATRNPQTEQIKSMKQESSEIQLN